MSKKTRIILFLVGIMPLVIVLVYGYFRPIGLFSNPERIQDYVLSFGIWAFLVFLIIQILQVVITPINHYVVGIAGGYVFGLGWGFVLNWIGRVAGHLVAFWLARTFGRPLVKKFVGENNLKKYDKLWQKGGGGITLFLIYFLPLFPDDEISYIVGVSDIKLKTFIIANLIGHTGGAIGLAFLGSGISSQNHWMMIIYAIGFIACFGLWFLRKKMERWVVKFRRRTKILIFTEGTIIMHKTALGHTREEIVEQVKNKEPGVKDYVSYVPVGNAVQKIQTWQQQGVKICYLTSRRTPEEIQTIQDVLQKHNFPKGELFYRKDNEQYKDVAERIMPDILIEDDCESIGGEKEMTYPHIKPELKQKITSIPVKEFGGIDHLNAT